MLVSPIHDVLLQRRWPWYELHDVRSDTTAQTTYTFTNCNVPIQSGNVANEANLYLPGHVRSKSRRILFVGVHGIDNAITFSLSGVTIGGVAGTEMLDRGGGTVAVNSGLYAWRDNSLSGITNTDIAVTWSEAITNCAIGVFSVDNQGLSASGLTTGASGQSTGALQTTENLTTQGTLGTYAFAINVTTNSSGTETLDIGYGTSTGSVGKMGLIYMGTDTGICFGATISVALFDRGLIPDNSLSVRTDWSGLTSSDSTARLFP